MALGKKLFVILAVRALIDLYRLSEVEQVVGWVGLYFFSSRCRKVLNPFVAAAFHRGVVEQTH